MDGTEIMPGIVLIDEPTPMPGTDKLRGNYPINTSRTASVYNNRTKDATPSDWSGFPSLYCNSATMIVTTWDFRLLFSEVVPGAAGTIVHVPRASVVMSPAHLKAFLAIANKNLAQYEKANGEVKWGQAAEK